MTRKPSPQQLASCEGKIAFATAGAAWAVMKRKRSGHHLRPGRRPYRCPYCHQWHLGVDTSLLKDRSKDK